MKDKVTVSVPATTANLGPGFDCLGLALELRNRLYFQAADKLTVAIHGEGQDLLPTDASNVVVQAAERVFDLAGQRPPGLTLVLDNRIPIGSGLGSSAAAVVGGILGAAALIDWPLTLQQALALAATMEGHPDNVAPALYGGLTLAIPDGDSLHVEPLPLGALTLVLVLPAFELPTVEARAALPEQVPMADAIFNISRVGLLIQALGASDLGLLRLAMQDRLHQPYRLKLIPGMAAAFSAAYQAGAAGVALSGAGPSVISLASANHEAIEAAVTNAFSAAGLSSRSWILDTAQTGALVSHVS